jgi:hypothetical protein
MLLTMKNLKLNRLAMQGALIAMLAGAVVLGGCGDESPSAPEQAFNNEEQNTPPEQNEPQETVLLEQTIQGPIARAGIAFTNTSPFSTPNSNPVQVTIESSDEASNILINIGLPNGGFATNTIQFSAEEANPATVTISNPQTGQGHALRFAEGTATVQNAVYTVRVTQSAE